MLYLDQTMLWSDKLMESWQVKCHQNHAAFVKKFWYSSTTSTFRAALDSGHIKSIKLHQKEICLIGNDQTGEFRYVLSEYSQFITFPDP